MPLGRTLVIVACISGGLACLAGAVEGMGIQGYVTTELSPGYGYSGIVVAMHLNPFGVVLAGLFSATMFVGADGVSRSLGIPSCIADVIVALSLLTILIAVFSTLYRIRRRGCNADRVALPAADVIEALRLKPTRLIAVKGGKVSRAPHPVSAKSS